MKLKISTLAYGRKDRSIELWSKNAFRQFCSNNKCLVLERISVMRKEGQNKDIHIPISTSIGTALIFSCVCIAQSNPRVVCSTEFPFRINPWLIDLKVNKKTIILFQFILAMEPRPLLNSTPHLFIFWIAISKPKQLNCLMLPIRKAFLSCKLVDIKILHII